MLAIAQIAEAEVTSAANVDLAGCLGFAISDVPKTSKAILDLRLKLLFIFIFLQIFLQHLCANELHDQTLDFLFPNL